MRNLISHETLFGSALLVVSLLLAVDLRDDFHHGTEFSHLFLEGSSFILSSALMLYLAFSFIRSLSSKNRLLTSELSKVLEERNLWQARSKQYLQGLASEISAQFARWHLSESESDIALLMLKGFSHKEIAQLRGTSERTVRQQATAVYAKAGLENKNQLAAFFLEDLILPNNPSLSNKSPMRAC